MSAPAPAAPGAGVGAGGGGASVLLKPSNALVFIITVIFIISQIFPQIDCLALVPGSTIPFIFNLFTAAFFEHTWVGLAVSSAGLLFFGRLFEPVWGSKEFIKFILVISLFASISTFMTAIILYYLTGNEKLIYTPIAGLQGVLAGFCVAVKQIFPDYDVVATALRVGKLRAKWLPAMVIKLAIVMAIFLDDPIVYVPFLVFGIYGSWIYLRYFQRRSESTVAGDPSAEFAFQTMFPEFLWPVLNPVSTWFDKLCCGRKGQQLGGDQMEDSLLPGSNPLPGSDSAEAARRRERGARALEERLIVSSNTKPADV